MAHCFEFFQVIDHHTAEEGLAILQCRLIDDHSCAFCLDPLHNSLNGALTEVIAVALHGQTIDTDGHGFLLVLIKLIFLIISIVASQLQYPVCDEIFSGTVALHNGLDQIFRHICIICQKLFGILRQTVAAIAKAWIVVMTSDTRIQTYTIDDLLGVKSFALCVCIKLVEISHTQRQIGICK